MDPAKAREEFALLPRGVRQFWLQQASYLRFQRISLDWYRRGAPELREYAAGYPKRLAFVMGDGPSIERVDSEEWKSLEKYFTIGVNRLTHWLQKNRGITTLPALCFMTDSVKDKSERAEVFSDPFERSSGRVLVGPSADGLPHDWCTHLFMGLPSWDLEYGPFLDPVAGGEKWARSMAAAAHACGMLGFEIVGLIGADHGPDIHKTEPLAATRGYAGLRKLFEENGSRLVNCSPLSSVESLEYVSIKEMLR